MWIEIQKINPVWYFDASGLFLRNIINQPANLLYSIVCHDVKKKIIVPIAEFFSTASDGSSIATYLIKIKDILEKNSFKVKFET